MTSPFKVMTTASPRALQTFAIMVLYTEAENSATGLWVISGFKALRQARAPVAGLEAATEGSLQISRWTPKPMCHRRPPVRRWTSLDKNRWSLNAIFRVSETSLD
ncbi:hypothetical protein PoB_004812600 [Plakobranchus ocellatus]|uniref:Uncharacterized protein n=1 Tax=Plakobranchus ocellatus TaxID=259542 RepID=A0AAV4BME0_9GAST|nr:hypothetical protein PoB_004812600 [Plakobranchus ocellatus]